MCIRNFGVFFSILLVQTSALLWVARFYCSRTFSASDFNAVAHCKCFDIFSFSRQNLDADERELDAFREQDWWDEEQSFWDDYGGEADRLVVGCAPLAHLYVV